MPHIRSVAGHTIGGLVTIGTLLSGCGGRDGYQATIEYRDGSVKTETIVYRDPNITGLLIGRGVVSDVPNASLVKIQPVDLPLLSHHYRDERDGLEIQGPSHWTMLTPDIRYHREIAEWVPGQRVRFYKFPYLEHHRNPAPFDSTPGWLNPALAVVVASTAGANTALEYAQRMIEQQRNTQVPVRWVTAEPKITTINGNDWLMISREMGNDEFRLHAQDYFLLKHGRIYWLSAIDKSHNFETDWPEFERTIQSCIVN